MVLAEAQRYPGLLGLAPIGQRLRVWTRFDSENVEMGTIDGERFEWPLETVDATPYDSRVMELRLDGSLLYFVADDPLRFADEFTETLDSVETTPRGVADGPRAREVWSWRRGLSGPARRTQSGKELSSSTTRASLSANSNEVTERQRRWSARPTDPLDRRTIIPVFPSTTAPPLRRSVDRERLVPLGPKGKLRKPKRHTHQWQLTDSTYGMSRYVCETCRHVTIDLTGPGALRPLVRR